MPSPLRTLLTACAALAAGCSAQPPELAAVAGSVTAGGKPMANVEVAFAPAPGTPGRDVAAVTGADGRYRIPLDPAQGVGVPVGTHFVLVRDAALYLVPADSGVDPASGAADGAAPRPAPRPASRVPAEYGDAAQTPLRGVRVAPGEQTYDVALPAK